MAKKKLTVKELEATRKGINKDEEDEKKAKAQGVRTSAPVYTYKDTNVTASDVAKKFNVQLPNKNASTGSNNAPGANAKAPVTSAAYTNKVADMFEKSKLYAAQGPDHVIDLANSIISGAATKPDKGNLGALDIDSIHDMTKITSEVARMLTDAGIFNIREIATNPIYAHLAQQEYRKSLLPTLQGELTNSQQADEANKAAQAEYEAKLKGLNADYSRQAEKAAQWKNFFSLLGENPTLEDKLRAAGIATGQTYDMGVFRGMDKYTAYEKKLALDEWFAGLDAAALSAAPVVEEPEAPKYTSKTAGIQDEIATLEKYINAYQTLEELAAYARSNPDFATASVYNAPVYEEPSVMERMFVQEMGGAYADDALAAYINGQPMMPQFMRDPRSEDFYKLWEEQGYNYMLDQDREIWNVLRTMDPAKADAYLQALSLIHLLPTRAQGYRSWDETVATNPWTAVPAWFGSALRGYLNNMDVPQQFVETWFGIDSPYSAAFDNLNSQGYTRGAQLGAIRESDMPDWLKTAAEYAYQGVSGFADNTVRLLGTGMNPTASLIMAGLQAASHSLHESAGRDDVSSAAKIIKAIGAGAIEIGTEKIGLDALFDMGKTGAKKYLSVVLSEQGEEFVNKMSEPALEAVVAFLFDHEADIKSDPEFWEDLKDTAITTYISASLLGGGAVASDYLDTRSYGEGIVNNGDADTIMNVGQSMPENSESKRVYDEITGKQGKGKKPSFYQFGQLTKAIVKDLGEERAAIVNRVQDEAIVERLVELGEDRAAAKQNASIIRRIARGEKVPRQEMFEAKWSDNASQVVKELTRETKDVESFAPGAVEDVGAQEIGGKWVEGNTQEAEANRTGNKWVTDMQNQQRAETENVRGKQIQVQVATVTPIGKAANRAEEAAKKRVPKRDGKPKLATDSHVTFRSADGNAEISGDIMRFEESDEGMDVVVQTGKGKEGEQKVKLEDWISADGDGVATILSYIGDEQLPHSVTAEEANTLMQVYKHSGGNAKAVIQAFDVNYLAGYSGNNQVGSVLDPALSKIAYENGKRDAERAEATRIERAKAARKVTNPTVGWIGDVSDNNQIRGRGDSAALDEAVKDMSDGQRYVVEYGKALAQKAHINVVFFNSKADPDGKFTADNGRYDPNTHTIYLDINAGLSDAKAIKAAKNKGTLGYAMMRTLGHEVTHAIESTSVEYYAKYKQAVKDALKTKGKDWATLVRDRIDEAIANGQKMTYGEAESEIVADASEYMLQDADFSKNLDTGIVNKIKTVVKNFVTTISDIFRELAKTGSVESYTLRDMRDGVYHYMDGLQELWDAGFDEMSNVTGSKPRQKNSDDKMQSSRRRDETYMTAVSNNDMNTAQKLVDEAAAAAGYTPIKLYHGTRHFGFKEFDINKMDDKISIFVTSNERIAESYSGENPNRSLKDSVAAGSRYDFLNRPAKELEKLVQENVDKNLRTPTEKELRQYTDFESGTILSAVDRVNEYMKQNDGKLNADAKQALVNIVYYGEKLAAIPYADLKDETDAYKLRFKYSDAVLDLSFSDRDVYDALAPLIKRPVEDSANNLITARFNDPFYNEKYATFTSKYDITDKLGDKLFNGIYDLYADQTNLLDIDANDSNWNTISGDLIERPGVFVATRDVAQYAKDNGYRGAVIRNVRDSGGMTAYSGASDVYILFDNNALKSADPVTYDDDGNVIPLSERFDVNDSDIRHSRRRDYQYTVDGARDFFQDSDTYHNFAETANKLIAANPRKKMHVFTITEYDDDTFLCVVINDGKRKFHLEDVAFIDLKEYTERNGNAYKLTDQIERMYIKYGKERTAELMGLIDPHVRGRFFAIDRGHGNRPIQARTERSEKGTYFEQAGRTAGERDQRGGLPEGSGEVSSPDGIEVDTETGFGYPVQSSARRNLPDELTTRDYLAESGLEMAETVEERNALTIYQDLLLKHADASDRVIAAEKVLSAADETELPEARKNLTAARAKQRDLYDRLLKVERTAHMQNVVKRSNQFINDLYGKNQADVDKRVAELERKAENLRWDLQGLKGAAKTQQEADIRAAEREIAALQSKATKALLANSEAYAKRLATIIERRDLNIEIGNKARHIKRVVKALNNRIVHEDDYKNVKEPLKPAVHTLVRTFLDGFGNLVFDQKAADKLKSVYDVLAQDDATVEYYDDEVSDWLTTLAKLSRQDEELRAGGSTLESLNDKLYIYTTLSDIADHVAHMVTAADTMFMEGRKASVSGVTEDIGNTLLAKEDRLELAGALGKAANFVDNLIIRGNMMPQFFFEGLNNKGMMQLYDGLQDGVRMYSERLLTGENFLEDAMRRYGYHTWRDMDKVVEFKTQQGHTIHLKRENMMWIYATAKREASNPLMDTHHLDEGGFVYEESSAPTSGLFKAKGHQKHHKIVQEDVEAITAMLTAEQIAFMDECVEFLSTECADWGNEASMQLFGIKKYKEKYYFPFKVDGGQLYKNSAAGSTSTTNDARVKHISFSHSIKKGANTPLVMGEFTSVIADHINQMATYSGLVVPIENMNRVLNRKVDDDGDMVTVRSLLGRKYGSPSSKYVDDLLKDLNGGPQTDNRGTWDAGIRLFKKNAVVGKMSVAIQQPTAITRAFAYISPRWFVNLHMERPKETWERMMKYSGTAVLKDMGGFNVGLGQGAKNWIERGDLGDYNVFKRSKFLLDQKGFKAAKDEWVDFLTGLPGWMDKVTWVSIWNAAENEQAHQHPGMDRNSDEFLQMVGRRFDDIVNHTQVYDSILSKSQNMRSKNTLAKMATSFMAESTLNMNLAYRAFASRDVKQIGKVVSSLLLNAALGAAAYALVGSWNKDDDDRTWEEKYAVAFAGRLADNLNPMASIPYLSDIWNKIQGYDVERTDLSYVLDLAEDGMKFFDKMFNPDEALSYRDYENFVGGMFAAATGIPAKNWMGDARRIWNMTHTKAEDAPSSRVWYGILDEILPGRGTNTTAYYERLLAATMDGDKQEMYDLKDYLMATKGVKETSITSGVRDAYKKVYMRGGISKNDAVNFLLANGLASGKTEAERKQSAFEYVDKWEEGTEGYSAYNTLRKAFSDGNSASIQKAWDELEANGWSDDSIGSYVRNTIIKGMVTSGQISPSKATELVRKWYPYKKDKDNVDKPKEWLNSK